MVSEGIVLALLTCIVLFALIYFFFVNKNDLIATIDVNDWATPGFLEDYCQKYHKRLTKLNGNQYKVHDMSLCDKYYLMRHFISFTQPAGTETNIGNKDGLSADIKLISK